MTDEINFSVVQALLASGNPLQVYAARRIEQLEAEVRRLTAKLDKYRKLENDGNVLIPMPDPWGPEDDVYDQKDGET